MLELLGCSRAAGRGQSGAWLRGQLGQALSFCTVPTLQQQISVLQWIMKARLEKVKSSFLAWVIKEPRLFCLGNTSLPAWLAPTAMQAALQWQSDSCMHRKWSLNSL